MRQVAPRWRAYHAARLPVSTGSASRGGRHTTRGVLAMIRSFSDSTNPGIAGVSCLESTIMMLGSESICLVCDRTGTEPREIYPCAIKGGKTVKFTMGDMLKIGLIAAVFIWLLKLIFNMVNIPGLSPAIEGL